MQGVAYEVQSEMEVERLQAYETENYEQSPCGIRFSDGRVEIGMTFKWVGDEGLLKVGQFDLKDWQMENSETS